MPSRFDRDLRVDDGEVLVDGLPVTLSGYGSESLSSETERSLEVGYRLQSGQRWSVDASIFWSYYGRLQAIQAPLLPTIAFNGGYRTLSEPMVANNAGAGRSYGGEIWGMWQVRSGWRLIPSYSYLNESIWLPASTTIDYQWNFRPLTVPHQALLRSAARSLANLAVGLDGQSQIERHELCSARGLSGWRAAGLAPDPLREN